MEAPFLTMSYVPEMLEIILKNMSYADILDFCNTNQRFRGLCEDPGSIVGEYLRLKRKEEVIAVFDTFHGVADQEFNISNLALLYDRGKTRIHIPSTTPHLVIDIVQSINREEGVYQLDDVTIIPYKKTFGDPKSYASISMAIGDAYIENFIDPKLLKAIFETALMGYDRNVEDNHYEILADYTARSPSIVF